MLAGLFLNQSAYDALHNMPDAHGGFLPITHKDAVESADLKGVTFSADLGTIFPPDDTAGSPATH